MGQDIEINWALKLSKKNGFTSDVAVGEEYSFSKDGLRLYPMNGPIDLINDSWEAIAKVLVVACTHENTKTIGKYLVQKIYSGVEKEILTKYWQENVELMLGKKIENFKGVKST